MVSDSFSISTLCEQFRQLDVASPTALLLIEGSLPLLISTIRLPRYEMHQKAEFGVVGCNLALENNSTV
jgi:hypothetical protein